MCGTLPLRPFTRPHGLELRHTAISSLFHGLGIVARSDSQLTSETVNPFGH